MKKILFLLFAVIAFNVTSQENVLLRYNFKKGDVYEIEIKMTQEVGVFMAQTTGLVMTQTTTSADNDVFVNEGKIDKMTFNMLQGGNTTNYDSSKKEEDLDDTGKIMKQQMDPILSSVITTKSNEIGEVIDISVEPNNPQTSQLTNQSSSIAYPKEAVKVGSEWSSTKEESGMTIKLTYKVLSISKTNVELGVTGEVSGLANGTASGNVSVDRVSGFPIKSKIEMKMETQGQKINITTENIATKK